MPNVSRVCINKNGVVIINDPELLDLISGGGDTCTEPSNTICGINIVCVPANVVCGGNDSGGGGVNRPRFPPQK